ncbi:PAS domain-containing protein [Streptomyces noursei]|nr:PAS domain-containing protein [Streptomyces noursei]
MGGATHGGAPEDDPGGDCPRREPQALPDPPPAGSYRDYFVMLLYRIPTPIAVCRADGMVLIANPAMAAQWGAVPGQLRGRNLLDRFRPRDPAQIARIMEALRLGRRSRYPVEVRWRTGPDEPERQGELTIDPVGDPSAAPPALLALLREDGGAVAAARRPCHAPRPAPSRPGSWRWRPAGRPPPRSAAPWA